MDKNARKVRSQDVNPCIDESDASQKCLDASNYDKSMCSAYFQRYKNCRKYWNGKKACWGWTPTPVHPTAGTCHSEPCQSKQCNPSPPATAKILADRVPFERNGVRVKELRHEYVQRILDMDGAAQPHECFYFDEAGFNLSKNRRRGRNIIGQRAIVHAPGQHGGNITLCAAISLRGLLQHHAKLGPYNAQHIITFLDALHDAVVQDRPEQPRFVVVWDNVSFHRAALVQNWFTNHDQFEVVYLPPYSPFLNPIEEFFSAWRWHVYDRQPHARMPLLQAMEQACGDIEVRSIQGWIRHTRGYFPRCLAREDIACDVDEILWPDPNRRQDP
ncbi:coiled-coil-helix-coiled-coil-helix domain-containing protein 7 isoform X3 [Epinephelus moara]|uniref:coiled-coil-helix-coiled-coil-helix domain-containing protein 7 isoform X3 n=1 Tax=Epinephelus moara TaxID=300413 RepID=UPI00214E3CE1|nr:coiled-coil-helix-coiled-coil-helix domain-containing protein 7 isoform X3 [Epinephelus moara]